MKYNRITIETSSQCIELLAAALEGSGFCDLQIEDPADIAELLANTDPTEYADEEQFADSLSDVPHVILYTGFDDTETTDAVKAVVADFGTSVEAGEYGEALDAGSLEVTVEIVDDGDWKDKWKEYLKPEKVSDRIWVRPSWEDFTSPDPDSFVIAIDPGMAFGTGTHATTYLTLRMMDKYLRKGDKVLDVGCGSGILSIAAVMMGAGEALGIDIDPEAVRVSRENFELNGVAGNARAELGDLTEGVAFTADIVVANLLTDLVIRLSASIPAHLAPGCMFISSGILAEHRQRVTERLESLGFTIIDSAEDNGWCCLAAKLANA